MSKKNQGKKKKTTGKQQNTRIEKMLANMAYVSLTNKPHQKKSK